MCQLCSTHMGIWGVAHAGARTRFCKHREPEENKGDSHEKKESLSIMPGKKKAGNYHAMQVWLKKGPHLHSKWD